MDRALIDAFERTWPAADYADAGGFRVGRGLGAGGRVSSAVAAGAWQPGDIADAEDAHRRWDQQPTFRVHDDDDALIDALTGAGYAPHTPTAIMTVSVSALTNLEIPSVTVFSLWPPLAIQREIWAAGRIDAARQAVMERACEPKTAILGRIDDRAAGAAFAAICHDAAIVHAVEVLPDFRRRGLAGWMMRQMALWARGEGAGRIGLAVSRTNKGARATYDSLGFTEAGGYAYYSKAS